MYLIDTSVWIEAFKKRPTFRIDEHFKVEDIYLCLPVYQEILQGIKEDSIFFTIKTILDYSNILESPISNETYMEATSIYRLARKKGITVRSSVDCLIAAIAIRNQATVVHMDRDFSHIARISPLSERNIK